jgi:hypothetical protein
VGKLAAWWCVGAFLWLGDIDLKQRGNIGVDNVGRVVKIDWDCSLNDIHRTEPDPRGRISRKDIELLPNIANFHADQWRSFVTEGCNETILKIIIESASMLDYQYAYVPQQQFDQFVKITPHNPEVFHREVKKNKFNW